MICPLCQANIEEESKFCGSCGKRIPRCPACGKVVEAGTRFCDEDGTRIPEETLALFTAEATVRVRPAPEPVAEIPQPVYTEPQTEYEPTAYVPPVEPVYPYANQPQPAPRKKSGNGLVIFVVLLLAVLVLVGGYFLWTEFFSEEEDDDSERSSASDKKGDDDEAEDEGENGEKGEGGNGGTNAATKATVPDASNPTESTTPPVEVPVVTYEYRYEVIPSDMSWSDADAVCRSKGGYLATIDSPEEYETICALIEEKNRSLPEDRKLVYLWLGSYLPPNSAHWKWSTGETIPLENYYWYKNEPSYEDEGVRENCLCLWELSHNGYDWTLNDQRNDIIKDFPDFSGKLGYICEYKIEVRK